MSVSTVGPSGLCYSNSNLTTYPANVPALPNLSVDSFSNQAASAGNTYSNAPSASSKPIDGHSGNSLGLYLLGGGAVAAFIAALGLVYTSTNKHTASTVNQSGTSRSAETNEQPRSTSSFKLSDDDRQLIKTMTEFGSPRHAYMNDQLRANAGQKKPRFAQTQQELYEEMGGDTFVAALDDLLLRMKNGGMAIQGRSYRGIQGTNLDPRLLQMNEGQIYKDEASLATDAKIENLQSPSSFASKGTIFHIFGESGVPIHEYSDFNRMDGSLKEQEILYPRATKFQILANRFIDPALYKDLENNKSEYKKNPQVLRVIYMAEVGCDHATPGYQKFAADAVKLTSSHSVTKNSWRGVHYV